MGQASLYGLFEMLGPGPDFVKEYPERISQVTAEKVQEVAKKYLTLYTLTTIRPVAPVAEVAQPES